jgi:hypothetical protein
MCGATTLSIAHRSTSAARRGQGERGLFLSTREISDAGSGDRRPQIYWSILAQRMHVLVDFDNVPMPIQRQGTVYVADRIFQALSPILAAGDRLELRLYGGWDQDAKLTPKAQLLHAELVGAFPRTLTLRASVTGSASRPIVMTAALADSLLIEPVIPLRDTYRVRPPARRLFCESPQANGCTQQICPLSPITSFVDTRSCPIAGCGVAFEDVVKGHSEQKVVDTAIVGDLIHLALTNETRIGVVSSDDDLWPGIAKAMQLGTTIYHVDAQGHGPTRYATGRRALYKPLAL